MNTEKLNDLTTELYCFEPLSRIAKRIRDELQRRRDEIVVECPRCGSQHTIEKRMGGCWCSNCAANPGDRRWIDAERHKVKGRTSVRNEQILKQIGKLRKLKTLISEIDEVASEP